METYEYKYKSELTGEIITIVWDEKANERFERKYVLPKQEGVTELLKSIEPQLKQILAEAEKQRNQSL